MIHETRHSTVNNLSLHSAIRFSVTEVTHRRIMHAGFIYEKIKSELSVM